MRTEFDPALLAEPAMATSESVIRKCVHCGFCNATCPTYVLLGDELDSPRGRIYLMKEMLENQRSPSAEVVRHIDRCLSCLSCMTTCPSGVNYKHLVDHVRVYIEERYRRPLVEKAIRALLAAVLPHPARFRASLRLASLARPLAPVLARIPWLGPLAAMLRLAPRRLPPSPPAKQAAGDGSAGRVILLQGCAEPVLQPSVREATMRLLARLHYRVSFADGEVCCGALVHHLGREADSLAAARRNVDAWTREIESGDVAAILVTASGCGTAIKDYGFALRGDPIYARKAAAVSALTRDITEFLAEVSPASFGNAGLRVAYHPACSLQHGQKVTTAPVALLVKAGFYVSQPDEGHLCCGSAGVYNILQSEIADQLGARKVANLQALGPDVIATGNIGCAVQIARMTDIPVVHTVELLDWASGGPVPAALASSRTGPPA